MIKRFLFVLALVTVSQNRIVAQNNELSSLFADLKKDKSDTGQIKNLNYICWEYRNIGLFDSALHYANVVITKADAALSSSNLSETLRLKLIKGKADGINNIGLVHLYKGDFTKALEYYMKALKLNESINEKGSVAGNLVNIGGVYWYQGNFPKALEYYLKALRMDEDMKNEGNIASDFSNIGGIYHEQKDYAKALDYYLKALKLNEKLKRKRSVANNLGNIGIAYYDLGMIQNDPAEKDKLFKQSLDCYFKALKTKEEVGNKSEIAKTVGNIGIVYAEQNNFPGAFEYYQRALDIFKELGDKGGIAINLGNIGSLYNKQKNYTKAEEYQLMAAKLSEEIGDLHGVMDAHKNLSTNYFKMGDYKKAYLYQERASIAKDSLFSIEKHEDLTRKELNYEYEKKEEAIRFENDKQAAVAAAENRKQKIVITLIVIGLILVVTFTLFIFRSLRSSQKQKRIIEIQKKAVETQKHLVEEKQKEIIDSIQYAKRIQNSLLPTEKYIGRMLAKKNDK
jgi:tetratricopeptide (TPR) repeat protein